jgi:twinkle protein
MGRIVKHHQPHKDASCNSSDGLQIYEDGTGYCFACSKFVPAEGTAQLKVPKVPGSFKNEAPVSPKLISKAKLLEIEGFECRGFRDRGITKPITEFYGVKASFNSDGDIDAHYYPYYKDGKTLAYKVRTIPKEFTWIGDAGGLFGMHKFPKGGKRIIITEGEIDAMSIAQAYFDKYERIYPVISVPSATGIGQLLENREYLRSFKEVILCFDADDAGEVALQKAIKIVGTDRAKIARLPMKDANEVLMASGGATLLTSIYDAQPWQPAGIISKTDIWKAIESYNDVVAVPYPACLTGVQGKLKGMRGGEITLFISGTGAGKSTLIREIELSLVLTHKRKIGMIHLEESPAESAKKLLGMNLYKNPSEVEIPIEELRKSFDEVFGEDLIVLLDHQGSIKDDSIIDKLEYMCLSGCTHIFIDHITILVSEGADGLTGNEAIDKVMNDLLRLVKRYPDVWIGLISHLRKAPTGGKSFEEGRLPSIDDIRGSGSIKQISFDIVSFARNAQAADEVERNTIKMCVLKARFTGLTGPVGGCVYDRDSGRLSFLPLREDTGFQVLDE